MRKTIKSLALAASVLLMLSASCEKVDEPPVVDTEKDFVRATLFAETYCKEGNEFYHATLDSTVRYGNDSLMNNLKKYHFKTIISNVDILKGIDFRETDGKPKFISKKIKFSIEGFYTANDNLSTLCKYVYLTSPPKGSPQILIKTIE